MQAAEKTRVHKQWSVCAWQFSIVFQDSIFGCLFYFVVLSCTCQVIDLRYICCHQIHRIENPELYHLFQVKEAVMMKHGLTDANIVQMFHGTHNENVDGISSDGFNRNFGRSGIYTPIFSPIKIFYICDDCLERRVTYMGMVLFLGGLPHPTQKDGVWGGDMPSPFPDRLGVSEWVLSVLCPVALG